MSFRITLAERNFGTAIRQHLPDTPDAKEESDKFRALYADVTAACSPLHIQAITHWFTRHVLPEQGLVDAFGVFISAISSAYTGEKLKKDGMTKMDIKVKLWSLVYMLNEILHETKFINTDRRIYDDCSARLRLPVINLLKELSNFSHVTNPKHFKRLTALLALWHERSYYDAPFIQSLKAIVDSEGKQLPAESKVFGANKQKRPKIDDDQSRKKPKLDPTKGIQTLGDINNIDENGEWRLPEWHGGQHTPWHLLPAACWITPILQTDHARGDGIKARRLKALHFDNKVVPRKVRKEVMNLLREAEEIYNPTSSAAKRIEYDQMGRKMEVIKVRKGSDGRVTKYVRGDTYYGWSPTFLEEMYKHHGDAFLSKLRVRNSSSASKRSTPAPAQTSLPPVRPDSRSVASNVAVSQPPNPSSLPPAHLDYGNGIPPMFAQGFPPPPPPPNWQPGPASAFPSQQLFPPRPPGFVGMWPPPPPPPPPPSAANQYMQPGQQHGWIPPPPPPPMQQHMPLNQQFNNGYPSVYAQQHGPPDGSHANGFRGGYNNNNNRNHHGGYRR